MTALEEKLIGWTKPSSDTEQEKQERTERMIREAIAAHPPFASLLRRVYAKGSYANNTNVRADSDVDVAVQCLNVTYWSEADLGAHGTNYTPYVGEWTPEYLRTQLVVALRNKFGASFVDISGVTAIQVRSNTARVEADVVPCFTHETHFFGRDPLVGAKVFRTDGGSVVNYSHQQLVNGRRKNVETSRFFKSTVRILKRLENVLEARGEHPGLPSYLVECLTYNVPNSVFMLPTWTEVTRGALLHIYQQMDSIAASMTWMEVNEVKSLFGGAQKWKPEEARSFASAGWFHLGFGNT